jgi:hypothetical protein
MFVKGSSFDRLEYFDMSDRAAELRGLTADLTDHSGIRDAFVAKSFTDRLVIVDTPPGEPVPVAARKRLADHECYGSQTVYSDDQAGPDFAGDVGDATRHHFVDVETRGDHQSYVVD